MSTLADELLNDFEDSGSEGEDETRNNFLLDESTSAVNGSRRLEGVDMEIDEGVSDEDEDEDMEGEAALKSNALEDMDDEEEAKAKVEKMQLGGVKDVRSVAGLMKTLQPVLEVGSPYSTPFQVVVLKLKVYIYLW